MADTDIMITYIAIIILFIAASPYIYYLLGIYFGRKSQKVLLLEQVPHISIIISAYNESAVIERRMENILSSDYPKDRYEILFIDDNSSDNTKELAGSKLKDSGTDYKIFSNDKRKGTNKSYNFALGKVKNNFVVTTDANKFFEKNALRVLISRLVSDDSVAAVCAETRPFKESVNQRTGGMESIYRNFFGRMCDWESANDSTYNFNGALVAFKKDIIGSIEENKGADDANTAFKAIRMGYRAVYVMDSVIYEKIPPDIHKQYKQKVRRAKRLIEATLSNLDLLKEKRTFSKRFYPVRIMMYIISPCLFLSGGIIFIASIFLFNVIAGLMLLILLLLLVYLKKSSFISSFILNQIYLFLGLIKIREDMRTWESTSV